MKTKTINRLEAFVKLHNSQGKSFTVKYFKKNGRKRILKGRIQDFNALMGKGMKFNPEERLLMPVLDSKKRKFRMINLDTVYFIDVNNNKYKVR